MSRIGLKLLSAVVMPLALLLDVMAQQAQDHNFPLDRGQCDTSNEPCMLGWPELAGQFPIRTNERRVFNTQFTAEPDPDPSSWTPPPGYVNDPTGGLNLVGVGDIILAEKYMRNGRLVHVGREAHVIVDTDGRFVPQHIQVLPGTRVSWSLQTFETVAVVADDGSFSSGATNLLSVTTANSTALSAGSATSSTASTTMRTPVNATDIVVFYTTLTAEGLVRYTNPFAETIAANRKFSDASDPVVPSETAEAVEDPTNPAYSFHPPATDQAYGTILVKPFSCHEQTDCSTCVLYEQCIWCYGGTNYSCMDMNVTTHMPVDSEMVIRTGPDLPGSFPREYQLLKYYDPPKGTYGLDWYPWPEVRTNPRPVRNWEYEHVTTRVVPVSSTTCPAYASRPENITVCPEYIPPPPNARVHGRQQANRPNIYSLLTCYDYVKSYYGRVDMAPPWPYVYTTPPSAPTSVHSNATSTAGRTAQLPSNRSNHTAGNGSGNVTAPGGPAAQLTNGSAINGSAGSAAVATGRRRELSTLAASLLPQTSAAEIELENPLVTEWSHSAFSGASDFGQSSEVAQLAASRAGPVAPFTAPIASAASSPAVPTGVGDGGVPNATLRDAEASSGQETRARRAPERRLQERRLQEDLVPVEELLQLPHSQLTETDIVRLVPEWQRRLLTTAQQLSPGALVRMHALLEASYGPSRCNATAGCDLTYGQCLNVTGGRVYGYDQNGTCACHHWFEGPDCTSMILSPQLCTIGLLGRERTLAMDECEAMRRSLYLCGAVTFADDLPEACTGLTTLQCLESGLVGQHVPLSSSSGNAEYVPNLIGHRADGFVMNVCAKCTQLGPQRAETMVRACRRSEFMESCQRDESLHAQRVCNQCSEDVLGSTLPDMTKTCSLYRGTCMGSVEKRIRGIVPPNQDIVGQTRSGGLRYCAEPATFSTMQHFYREDNIMIPGESCINYQRAITNWDNTKQRQRDNPATVLDPLGLQCANPDDEATCPKMRKCVPGVPCHQDIPDWTDMQYLRDAWGAGAAEYLNPGDTHDWSYLSESYTWETVEWGIRPTSGETTVASG